MAPLRPPWLSEVSVRAVGGPRQNLGGCGVYSGPWKYRGAVDNRVETEVTLAALKSPYINCVGVSRNIRCLEKQMSQPNFSAVVSY